MSYAGLLRDEFNNVIEHRDRNSVDDVFFLYTYLLTRNGCYGTALSRWNSRISLVCTERHKKHSDRVNVHYKMIVEAPKVRVEITNFDQFGRVVYGGLGMHLELSEDNHMDFAWGNSVDVIVSNLDDIFLALEELLYGWRWPIMCLADCATKGMTRRRYLKRVEKGGFMTWGWRKLNEQSLGIKNKDIRLNDLSKFEWELVGAIMRHGVYKANELAETVIIAKQMILKYGTKECQRMMDEAEKGSRELHFSAVDIRHADVAWRYNLLDNWQCNQLPEDELDEDPVKEEDELVSLKLFK